MNSAPLHSTDEINTEDNDENNQLAEKFWNSSSSYFLCDEKVAYNWNDANEEGECFRKVF